MRTAIYLTPLAGSPLAQTAERWLGRSASPGVSVPAAAAPPQARVEIPARYGFHATLKAPFTLRDDVGQAELLAVFADFCTANPPLEVVLRLEALDGFVALTAADQSALSADAERAVRHFDGLRAPLTAADRDRRGVDRLDDRARNLFEAWGYPWVFELFTFHMTLSGPVVGADVATVMTAARGHFAAELARPQRLVHALFREDVPHGPFSIIATQPSDGAL